MAPGRPGPEPSPPGPGARPAPFALLARAPAIPTGALGDAHLVVASVAGVLATLATAAGGADAPAIARAHGAALVAVSLLPALLGGLGNRAAAAARIGTTACPRTAGLGLAGAAAGAALAVAALLAAWRGAPSGRPLALALGLALGGAFATALALSVTLLSGRPAPGADAPASSGRSLAFLPPDAIGTLVGALVLAMALPCLAAVATHDLLAGARPPVDAAILVPLAGAMLPLALGTVWRVIDARPGRDAMPALAAASLGFLPWAHALVASGAPAVPAGWRIACALGAAPAMVSIARRRLAGRPGARRGVPPVAVLHAASCLALLAAGLLVPRLGDPGRHGAIAFGLLFAAFAGLDAPPAGSGARGISERLRLARFVVLAAGAALMLACAPDGPCAARGPEALGEAAATVAALLLALEIARTHARALGRAAAPRAGALPAPPAT